MKEIDAKNVIVCAFAYFTWIGVSVIGIQLCLHYSGLMATWSLKNNFLFASAITFFYQYSITCMMLLAVIYFTLKTWNELIDDFLSYKDEYHMKFGTKLNHCELIRLSARIQDRICDTLDCYSSCFQLVILTLLLEFFYMSLLALFNLLSLIITKNITTVYFVILVGLWCLQFLPLVLWLTSFSNLIENEGQRLDDLIDKLLTLSNRTGGTKKRVNAIHLQAHHRPPIVCCRFFKINWYLFFDILCAIMNYFIILIQMYDA